MGKVTLFQCDWCKAECKEDETSTLTFKKPGSKRGRAYDVCPKCSAKLEQQLVGSVPPAKSAPVEHLRRPDQEATVGGEMSESEQIARTQGTGTVADFDLDADEGTETTAAERRSTELDDDELVARIERDHGHRQGEQSKDPATGQTVIADDGSQDPRTCLHANLNPRIKLIKINGRRVPHRQCKSCGKMIVARSSAAKSQALNLKAPPGVNLRDA